MPNFRQQWLVASIMLAGIAAFTTSLTFDHGFYLVSGTCSVCLVICLSAALCAAGIEWGSPCLPRSLWAQGLIIGVALQLPSFAIELMQIDELLYSSLHTCFAIFIVVPCQLNLRGPAILPFIQWGVTIFLKGIAHGQVGWVVGGSILACAFILDQFVIYLHDQRVLGGLLFVCLCSAISAMMPNWLPQAICYFPICAACYGTIHIARMKRNMPPALRQTRFVRLSFLRKMRLANHRIPRCQDLPDDAFGNVSKARKLIITSHRWLNRYTCDIVTDECPQGIILNSIIQTLGKFFPDHWTWSAKQLFCGLNCSGSDVLIFFDFMGLPQTGQNSDGIFTKRTPEEHDDFSRALPAMGSLYAVYPVLVLPEVTPEQHPYHESGWCFCEFMTALLTHKLDKYSNGVVKHLENRLPDPMVKFRMGCFNAEQVTKFTEWLDEELAVKVFACEQDRGIVRGIVVGYLTRRLLWNAIEQQNVDEVKRILEQLAGSGLPDAVNEHIDHLQNTLLHLAVRHDSGEIVEALLAAGAEPDARNLLGDTPLQFHMFPRFCSGGARTLRDRRRKRAAATLSTTNVASARAADRQDHNVQTITITREGPLGMHIAVKDEALVVKEIYAGTFIDTWNARNPDSKIIEGDRITKIDGAGATLEIVNNWKEGSKAMLEIVRDDYYFELSI